MFHSRLIIDNRDEDAEGSAAFTRLDPISGATATIASAATLDDASRAANAAAAAFSDWSVTGPNTRRKILTEAAGRLLARADDFIAAMTAETGATEAWCRFNLELGAEILRDAAGMATQICGSLLPSDQGALLSMGLRQPAGVCLGMAPWNAPVILGVRAIAMPLACGNTVVLKASELCPQTHRLIGEVMIEAGTPPGVVNVVSNAPADAEDIVEVLIAHPAVRRVNFTGSTRVGRIVAQIAARHLKPCLLELGGKAPFLVLADADLDHAADAAAFGAFFNQGQICMSTERIILLDAIADDFAERFAARARAIRAGEPRVSGMALGSMIGAEAVQRVRGLVDDARDKGALLLAGGTVHGNFMDATVLDHVTPHMRLYREESFGPVAALIRARNVDEAVTIANDCQYGLSAAVFGRDISQALAVARRIESGICHINGATVSDDPHAPFGGVKASGHGRFGGQQAIEAFTELRWITVNPRREPYPI
ncbi:MULTISPECIES: aldehyde dehydrogenase [Alphaproteobacteria]|uniref:Salicylaldehyde dehydrogenase n=2 Tax=Alphaproteobacteria TaxID=28211 RepID=A0A512HN55_9HYPH|nr:MULTISPECIES: aldehyde dehydrogenase [Alphaproteobacteria]GEO86885.1 salicylaldehyde dehydrogenase [Ciceribacter naphthalenivorans]GLR22199.1 salicylaldehyde dehydrogenase [Ciceribacter naphthalenivorans]GLT05055.1 salicylaldehyde dehydrogenase [Sphingomonas psychrolutea]